MTKLLTDVEIDRILNIIEPEESYETQSFTDLEDNCMRNVEFMFRSAARYENMTLSGYLDASDRAVDLYAADPECKIRTWNKHYVSANVQTTTVVGGVVCTESKNIFQVKSIDIICEIEDPFYMLIKFK